jgi:hypothetical protein
VGVGVDVGVSVGVGVAVDVGVFVGVFVGVLVGVFVGVFVGVLVGVFVGVLVGVFVGVDVGVWVGVLVPVAVGVAVGVDVGVSVGVAVGVTVGVFVAAAVGVGVGVLVGPTKVKTRWSMMIPELVGDPAACEFVSSATNRTKSAFGWLIERVAFWPLARSAVVTVSDWFAALNTVSFPPSGNRVPWKSSEMKQTGVVNVPERTRPPGPQVVDPFAFDAKTFVPVGAAATVCAVTVPGLDEEESVTRGLTVFRDAFSA